MSTFAEKSDAQTRHARNGTHMKDGFSGSREVILPEMIVDMMRKNPIMADLYVTDIGYYPHATHHAVERKKPIEEYVLIYVMDGTGHYWVESHEGVRKEYTVSANQYFILPAHQPHAYWTEDGDPWTIYWIHFAGQKAIHYGHDAISPKSVKPELYSRIANRTDHFEEIFAVLHDGYTLDNLTYVSSLLNYYLCSLRYLHQYRLGGQRTADNGLRTEAGDINIVNATVHYMNEHIEKRLSRSDLADYSGYSASHLSDLFRKATGYAPLAYFNMLKVQYACQMLDNTPLRINQICYKVGFDDCYYFSRLFRKIKGISPSQYKQQTIH